MKHQIGMVDSDKTAPENGYTDVRVRLPYHLIEKLEILREEWGFQSRGSVLARLLETVLEEDKEIPKS